MWGSVSHFLLTFRMRKVFYLVLILLIVSCDGKMIEYTDIINGTRPIGPYSYATTSKGIIFTSGQLGLNPKNNALEPEIEGQTKRAFDNLALVLQASGSDMKHVLKVTIYLADIRDYALVNKIYESFFPGLKPARTTLQVASLPGNALIEIEGIAVKLVP